MLKWPLNFKSVVNLVNPDVLKVPDSCIALLAYGKGFVSTPQFDAKRFRLDARNCSNRLGIFVNKLAILEEGDENQEQNETITRSEFAANNVIPSSLLKADIISANKNTKDSVVESVRQDIVDYGKKVDFGKMRPNIGSAEREGLDFLKKCVKTVQFVLFKLTRVVQLLILIMERT